MSIRQLATSLNGAIVAAGQFERRVHIWDVTERKLRGTLETILDFGGRRLAITEDGQCCIAGAYRIEGIAAYSTSDGTEVWRRKDLKKVQKIQSSLDGRRVFCSFDAKPCHVLNRETGRTRRTLTGVRSVWESPYEPLTLLVKRELVLQSEAGKKLAAIPCKSFAVLSVAFAPGFVCVSESAGPTRCLSTQDGREIWRSTEAGEHALRLAFDERSQAFVGVCWSYEVSGPHLLRSFALRNGESTRLTELPALGEFEFAQRGSRLLSSDGFLFDTATGSRVDQFDFPVSSDPTDSEFDE
jgi:hypothetical protein